jgi:inner membrane protein
VDNLTHSLAGAALGEAGLKRVSGLGMAALVLGANIPDIDAAVLLTDADMLVVRRGWTHGPIALVLLPLLLTGVLVLFDRWQRRRNTRPRGRAPVRPPQLLALAFIGCLTHPLLDWMNVYGIRLLMPFSERWYYGDALQIIDPWIWLALGIGVVLARRRSRAGAPDAPRPAHVALAAVTLYIALMIAGSRIAHQAAVQHLAAGGIDARRIMAGPVFVNSFRRELIIDEIVQYRFGTVRLAPGIPVSLADSLATNLVDPLAVAASGRDPFRGFLYWSRFPYFVIASDTAGETIELRDARFRLERPGAGSFRRQLPVHVLRAD